MKLYVYAYEVVCLLIARVFVEADITISGLSFSVNPDDATTAELSFSVRKMTGMFGGLGSTRAVSGPAGGVFYCLLRYSCCVLRAFMAVVSSTNWSKQPA